MFKHFRLETDSNNFKVSKMPFLKKKKPYFEEELVKNRNEPKRLWKALKSLDLSLDKVRKSKISVKKDGTIQFEAMKNVNTFKRLYSELVRGLQGKLPKAPSNLLARQTKITMARLHATFLMTLNNQMFAKRLLKRFFLA